MVKHTVPLAFWKCRWSGDPSPDCLQLLSRVDVPLPKSSCFCRETMTFELWPPNSMGRDPLFSSPDLGDIFKWQTLPRSISGSLKSYPYGPLTAEKHQSSNHISPVENQCSLAAAGLAEQQTRVDHWQPRHQSGYMPFNTLINKESLVSNSSQLIPTW